MKHSPLFVCLSLFLFPLTAAAQDSRIGSGEPSPGIAHAEIEGNRIKLSVVYGSCGGWDRFKIKFVKSGPCTKSIPAQCNVDLEFNERESKDRIRCARSSNSSHLYNEPVSALGVPPKSVVTLRYHETQKVVTLP